MPGISSAWNIPLISVTLWTAPCQETSCGVDVQGMSCPHPTPRPTPAPTTPAPTTPAPTTPAPTPTPIVDAAHRLSSAGAMLLALALAA